MRPPGSTTLAYRFTHVYGWPTRSVYDYGRSVYYQGTINLALYAIQIAQHGSSLSGYQLEPLAKLTSGTSRAGRTSLSAGQIAGMVVGPVLGGCLIICAFLAHRLIALKRRRQGQVVGSDLPPGVGIKQSDALLQRAPEIQNIFTGRTRYFSPSQSSPTDDSSPMPMRTVSPRTFPGHRPAPTECHEPGRYSTSSNDVVEAAAAPVGLVSSSFPTNAQQDTQLFQQPDVSTPEPRHNLIHNSGSGTGPPGE